eukprot:COSAG04_NODE_517_length_13186_cov_7.434248_12_plen_223_part_00
MAGCLDRDGALRAPDLKYLVELAGGHRHRRQTTARIRQRRPTAALPAKGAGARGCDGWVGVRAKHHGRRLDGVCAAAFSELRQKTQRERLHLQQRSGKVDCRVLTSPMAPSAAAARACSVAGKNRVHIPSLQTKFAEQYPSHQRLACSTHRDEMGWAYCSMTPASSAAAYIVATSSGEAANGFSHSLSTRIPLSYCAYHRRQSAGKKAGVRVLTRACLHGWP